MCVKKALCSVLGIVLWAGLCLTSAQAAVGDVVGTVCWSDISVRISGRTIPAYNWNGHMVVPAENLREYGFSVSFDWEGRTLHIERNPEGELSGSYTPPRDQPQAGTAAFEIVETDIITDIQGEQVEGLNIDGTTMVRLSDLSRCGTVSWDPVNSLAELTLFEEQPLTIWEAGWTALNYDRNGTNAEVVFRREQDQIRTECLESPFDDQYAYGPSFELQQTGWRSSIYSGVEETDSNWTKGWYALWMMAPAPWQEGFAMENTPELREQVARYLKITWNGEPVSGILWAMRGNGHIDLNFVFDKPVYLAEGDQLCVWVGMPEQEANPTGKIGK